MKKTITINISGIVFHIEEDGYEALKIYLDSVKKHFGGFQDSSEIITDIESRIAEIFTTKISDTKQALTKDDIDQLIRTMGQPADFADAESAEQEKTNHPNNSKPTDSIGQPLKKKIYRDNRRKVIGGVCAGLAHYLKTDPAWIRVLFAALIFAGGFIIIAYILMWAIIPGSYELEDQTSIKKIYRDSDKKVIGGVAAGISAYTGLDISIVRLIFTGLLFAGGFGLILYIILWTAVPEAKTLTERMEMEGQPVTLSNIEKTVREKLNEKEGEESTLAKIILFPFRLFATILKAVGSALVPILKGLGKVLRIMVGVFLMLIGTILFLTTIILFAVILGIISGNGIIADWTNMSGSIPLEAYQNTFSGWTILFTGLALFIPFLLIALLGISLILNRSVLNKIAGWSLFAVFVISAAAAMFTLPATIIKFSKDGYFKREQTIDTAGKIPLLRIRHAGLENYEVTKIRLHGHTEPGIRIVEKFESQGSSRSDAQENARMTDYQITHQDSIITFDSNLTFKKGASFRGQRLEIDVYFPLNKPFVIEKELWELIRNYGGYYHEDRDRNTFVFDEGGLKCLTCEEENIEKEKLRNSEMDGDEERDWNGTGVNYQFKNFDAINLAGYFDATIVQGNKYEVTIEDEDELRVSQEGNRLIIKTDDENINLFNRWEDRRVKVNITMPSLDQLDAAGAGKFQLRGFKKGIISLSLAGAIKGEADLQVEELEAKLIGASKLRLKGKGKKIDLSLTGASKVEGYDFKAEEGEVDAVGASTAEVNVSRNLNSNAMLASRVKNIGGAKTND